MQTTRENAAVFHILPGYLSFFGAAAKTIFCNAPFFVAVCADQNLTSREGAVKEENVATASFRYSTWVLSSVAEYMAFRLG